MRILAIDSASTTGWASLDGERLIAHGTVDATDPLRIDAHARRICAGGAPDLVVIEDSFLGKNPTTVKVLARIQGRWEMAFAIRGVRTELVLANVWQAGVLGKIPKGKGQTKKVCGRWVSATHHVDAGEDENDAIAMGTYVARRERFAAMLARAPLTLSQVARAATAPPLPR